MCKKYKLVRSIIANDAEGYIRKVDPNDPDRCRQYREDAILTNFTRLTKDGLTGLVFRKAPVCVLPQALQYTLEDATGENLSLDQLANRCVGELLQTGRYGLLADFPAVDPQATGYDKEKDDLVARIKPYASESIINYKCKQIGSKYILSIVVLQECICDNPEDPYMWDDKVQYRVLLLDENNYYRQELYDQDLNFVSMYYPTDYDGKYLNEIPFVFIGSENNDPVYDEIPLYDLAVLNCGHYRNSADLEESGFITGQPFPVICVGESSPEQFAAANPNGVSYGSRGGLTVGNGGHASLLQANPNQLVDQMMMRKEVQAAAIGARLITPGGGRETAEAARIRFGAQNSSLGILTANIGLGLVQVLQWVYDFMASESTRDVEPGITYILNDEFYEDTADPNLLVANMQLLDRGVIAKNDIRDYLRQTGTISEDRTNDQIEAEAEIADPLAGTNVA